MYIHSYSPMKLPRILHPELVSHGHLTNILARRAPGKITGSLITWKLYRGISGYKRLRVVAPIMENNWKRELKIKWKLRLSSLKFEVSVLEGQGT